MLAILSPHPLQLLGQRRLCCTACHWLCLILTLALCTSSVVCAAGFKVLRAETRPAEPTSETSPESAWLWLNADVSFTLSQTAIEALNNSIPLTLVLRIQLLERGALLLLWDRVVTELEQRYRLKYHALAEQYTVENLNSETQRSFPTRRAALSYIGRLRKFPLPVRSLLKAGKRYYGQLRAELDIEALPAPLRPVAYLSGHWRLSSEWYTWPL